jgi:hypothetical protein
VGHATTVVSLTPNHSRRRKDGEFLIRLSRWFGALPTEGRLSHTKLLEPYPILYVENSAKVMSSIIQNGTENITSTSSIAATLPDVALSSSRLQGGQLYMAIDNGIRVANMIKSTTPSGNFLEPISGSMGMLITVLESLRVSNTYPIWA